jgi:acyl-CoA reductase-like NAD-dependent aldehyde dehydrogenase
VINIPVVRWGKPYESLELQQIVHFATGEPIASIGQANGGIVSRDLRKSQAARNALREFSCDQIIEKLGLAADLYENQTLPLGDGRQSPADFAHHQSATTGLPEHMCRSNMTKNAFVLRNMGEILDCLTRGLDLEILTQGYGVESRGVTVSYQAQSPVLGAVLPSNSPGVHTLWLPAIALQLGLVLKPGSQEPWTAYRLAAAFEQAGLPAEAISLYPGGHDVGQAILSGCARSMIFGSEKTIAQYAGNPRVQVHGPGFSKILLGDDCVDDWEKHLDMMVESIVSNGGRSCINCSGIWAARHTREIAEALAGRLGKIEPLPADDPKAALAAFTAEGQGAAIWKMIEDDLKQPGVQHLTERFGPRLVATERYAYLRPTVVHCDSPDCSVASKEFMFPFVSVVRCEQNQMLDRIGPTLVASVISEDETWLRQLTDATQIDRLNLGPIPTQRLNWLQPHEGNLIEFLFRSRALQRAAQPSPAR